MDNLEIPKTKRDFKDLTDSEKIRAILGAVREPVSKNLAIELADVDYGILDEKDKKIIDGIFFENNVEKNVVEGEQRYILNDDGKLKLESETNMYTVHGQIADILWKAIGMDET